MLDEGSFGHWKAQMRHIIRGIDEDAWTAVELGWSPPTMLMEDHTYGPKPKERWTESEKVASKFNSKALTVIFSAVDLDQFKIIQGCESAKEAWDVLINHFEGDTSVRRTRIDHLATRFENLRMEDESIASFVSKISSIASAASVLGKKYKESELIKKLLRCLPPRFEAYKAVLKIAMNTDDMKFDQLAGIFKVQDLEKNHELSKTQKGYGIVFAAESEEEDRVQRLEDNLTLMVQKFNKMVKHVGKGEKGSGIQSSMNDSQHFSNQGSRSEPSKGKKENNLQCRECEGFGHLRKECPVAKIKELRCIECKGIGHTASECPSNLKKDRSLLCFSDTESESESDEDGVLNNFVALTGQNTMSDHHSSSDSDSEREGEDMTADLKSEYRALFKQFAELSHENLQLIKDTAMLKAQVNILELEQPNTKAETEPKTRENGEKAELQSLTKAIAEQNRVLQESETKFHQMKQLLNQELEKNQFLERQLTENHKKVRMLNTGSATLDHILSIGQSPKISSGLGYQGLSSQEYSEAEGIKFIKAEDKSEPVTKMEEKQNTTCGNEFLFSAKRYYHGSSSQTVEKNKETKFVKRSIPVVSADNKDETQANTVTQKIQDSKVGVKRRNGCHFCGKIGHRVAYCYARRNQFERAWRLNLCFIEPKKCGYVWIAKRDLYPKFSRQTGHELHLRTDVSHERAAEQEEEVLCNLARIQVKEPEIKISASPKLHHKRGFSHLGREKHDAVCECKLCQSHIEKKVKMEKEKETSGRGDQGDTYYVACNNEETVTKVTGHVDQMGSVQHKAIGSKTESLSQKDVTHREKCVTPPSIGESSNYLTTIRSQHSLITDICTLWQAASEASHPLVVRKISNHVKGILELKLHNSLDTNMMMTGVCDANWMFFLDNDNLKVCYKVSPCLAETENIVLRTLRIHMLVKRSTHAEYGNTFDSFYVHCNNLNVICIPMNLVQLSLTEQVVIRHHLVRELEEEKLVIIEHVASENKAVDIVKLPYFNCFLCMRKALGISDL